MAFTLLLAVTAAVAASMGYLAARRHGAEDEAPPDSHDEDRFKKREQEDDEASPTPAPRPAKKPGAVSPPFATLPLALGDVVSAGTDERWLAGAVVARENGRVVGAVFLAPEGVAHHAVAVFAAPRKDIWWLSPVEVASPEEPPATLEIDGMAMSRKGRLPVTLERLGQGAPPVGDEGIWAAYDRGRDVAVVIASQRRIYAWSGRRLEEDEYDRLGGGGD